MSTRIKSLEACVRNRLLYSAQSWELTAAELNKIELIWHGFLRKMITNGFKCKNVPKDYLKYKEAKVNVAKPDDLDWSYVYTNEQLETITKTTKITDFCKIQHYKYVAHVTRLENNSLQKQILFTCERKNVSSDGWRKISKELNLDTRQIQNTMQNKKEFLSLLTRIYK